MRKIKDIKVRVQLFAGFAIILLLVSIISFISWRQIANMNDRTVFMYNHPLTVRGALAEFNNSFSLMRVEYRNAVYAKTELDWNIALTEYNLEKDNADNQFEILYDRYLGNLADIDSLKYYFALWNDIHLKEIDTWESIKNNGISEENIPMYTNEDVRQFLLRQIVEISDFAAGKALQYFNESESLKRKMQIQFLVFLFGILIISFIIVYFLAKLITEPIKELISTSSLFHKGDKSERSTYISKNEFGSLSKAFNIMAEAVESEFILKNDSIKFTGEMLKEDEPHKFCFRLLNDLLEITNSQMGAVYLLNSSRNSYEVFESIGLNSSDCRTFSANNTEGAFGLAIASKKLQHVTDIPDDTKFKFVTVAGNFKPREFITLPVFSEGKAVAIISIFSIHKYSDRSLRLLDAVLNALISRMNAILSFKTIVEFSKQLEEKNIELDAQKTELESMADELVEQNAELEQQKQQLNEVNQLKTSFLSSISHELRTPLNSVIALSGVLNRRLSKKIPDEEYSYLGVIERNGKHLLNLINDILDLTRIESGKIEVHKSKVNINNIVSEIVAMIKPQADQKKINLVFENPNKEITVESDYDKCFHILQNIVSNAVKFTEKGKVKIVIDGDDKFIKVKTIDTGIGIDKDDIPRVFEEFRQLDGSNSKKFGGTGLGLSIASKYAQLIGARIDVKSEKGKGSEFTLVLPREANYTSTDGYYDIPIQNNSVSVKDQKPEGKILLVEDTESMVIQMKDILEEVGYEVAVARNGSEALEYLEHTTPDAVLLDVMMPGINGIDVLVEIRKREQTATLPVLILTAKILSKEEISTIRNNNVHQLLQKGKVTKDSLLEAIALLMHKKDNKIFQSEINPVRVQGLPRILAVEDNIDNMISLKAQLKGKCIFIEASDGFEGIKMAKLHKPDLIFMDVAMPGKNGFETLSEMRKDPDLVHIPVIVVTSSAMKGDRNYFLEYGFDGYISKPVDSEVLNEIISKWIIDDNKG